MNNNSEEFGLTKPVDFSDTAQMARDCWEFFAGEENRKTVTREAFLHEVGAMLENVKRRASAKPPNPTRDLQTDAKKLYPLPSKITVHNWTEDADVLAKRQAYIKGRQDAEVQPSADTTQEGDSPEGFTEEQVEAIKTAVLDAFNNNTTDRYDEDGNVVQGIDKDDYDYAATEAINELADYNFKPAKAQPSPVAEERQMVPLEGYAALCTVLTKKMPTSPPWKRR